MRPFLYDVHRLFEENAELLNLFQKFQDLKTKESQRESMELAQHASLVMSTLDEAINSLDDVDHFIEYLHSVGRMHVKVKGFKREYFWKIEQPFLLAVKETLDERYTDNIEVIYKITVKFILQTLVDGYDSACTSSEMPNGNASVDNNPAASSSNAENNCE
ncbi:cytoglobin-1-like protein [Leptotrombidium deliense]|uniref:Cytoglobin-1-like protein n=1 Tax=Leptotrombidium deliense TaxID=299467 RepID=A0A443SFI5_9ACAR|nr:cytoglobin-1-like protein [Leptotrombidium deliense]